MRLMPESPTPQTIPSDADYDRAQVVVEGWLARFPGAVAPHSNAANDLRDHIAIAIAEGCGDELRAEQPNGKALTIELDGLDAVDADDLDGAPTRIAIIATLRRLTQLTRAVAGLDSVVLPLPGEPEGVRIVAVRSLEDWLEGLATTVQYGGTL